ncbi:MAG: hypothetical protein ACXVCP_15250 [Bdellovibrio sp.]
MKELTLSLLYLCTVLLEILLGSLTILGFQGVVNAKWLNSIEFMLKPLLKFLLIVPVLLLLIFLAKNSIYPWTDIGNVHSGFPKIYFNTFFFVARNIVYFFIWYYYTRKAIDNKLNDLSGALAIIAVLLTGTYWAQDWIASLDLDFKSTVFGLIYFVSAILLTFGFVVSFLKNVADPQDLQDINNVHLALVGTWTYLAFVQLLIIWSGNLPDESIWYIKRSHSSWHILSVIIVIFQSILPLFALLVRKWKASLGFTKAMGFLSFVLQLCFLLWMLGPFVHSEREYISFIFPFIAFILLVWVGKRKLI